MQNDAGGSLAGADPAVGAAPPPDPEAAMREKAEEFRKLGGEIYVEEGE